MDDSDKNEPLPKLVTKTPDTAHQNIIIIWTNPVCISQVRFLGSVIDKGKGFNLHETSA